MDRSDDMQEAYRPTIFDNLVAAAMIPTALLLFLVEIARSSRRR
jgi:hypothetical protein